VEILSMRIADCLGRSKARAIGAAVIAATAFLASAGTLPALAAAHPPTVPDNIHGKDGVKAYLLMVVDSSSQGATDLKKIAVAYDQLVTAHGGAVQAAQAEPQKMADLIHDMRDAYERIDSYGYEYMEGIVAGVPSLMKYDIELDSGVPQKGAQLSDTVADITIKSADHDSIKEGSLNNFLIEPTVFGTNPPFVAGTASLPGFDKPVNLPKPKWLMAIADYAIGGYARLKTDSIAWQPTDKDCFHVLVNMTPTLADYFDDWKESRKYGAASGGRFVAVSRVSDMRGIMKSTRLTWLAVHDEVDGKNPKLAATISDGYDRVLTFIDRIDERNEAKPLNIEMIDKLGTQAKERADKLTVQASESATLMGIDASAR
jgi:hypothetical protein